MTIPIYKKTIFDAMGNKQIEIADKINETDRKDIERLVVLFMNARDARGNWTIPRNEGLELFKYFQKYVDEKASPNIFGCGGCAKKMIEFMVSIDKIWRSQIK